MTRDRRTRLESFSARESEAGDFDDLDDFRPAPSARPAKPRSLVLQVALGVWLGGMALGLTWWLISLMLFGGAASLGALSLKFGG